MSAHRLGRNAFVMLIAALLVAALPGSALAATRPTTFWLYMGMSCVGGTSSDFASVDVLWRRANGRVVLHDTYSTRRGGGWELCSWTSKPLRAGDRVSATVNGVKHRLVIPTLTIQLDSASDRVFGRAPAGAILRFGWYGGEGTVKVKVGADRHWSYSEPGLDIVPGDGGFARWKSTGGDTVTFENSAP